MKSILYVVFACMLAPSAFAQDQPVIATLTAPGGRYVFGQITRFARDQFMLDTQTGRLWQIVCVKKDDAKGDCRVTAMEPVLYSDGANGESALPPTSDRRPSR